MIKKTTYYGKINGYDAMTCDFIPENMTVERSERVLYSEENKLLLKGGEAVDYIVLEEGDSAENYEEIEISKEKNEKYPS